MGMAASQARLLTITARIHDVEYEAQSIQNAKMQLATQSDQVYKDYLAALDATTLTVMDYQKNTIQANFNNIRGLKAVDTGKQYALRDENDRLIVSDEEKTAYEKFKDMGGTSAQEFALIMIIGDDGQSRDENLLKSIEDRVFHDNQSNGTETDKSLKAIKEKMEKMTSEKSFSDFDEEEKQQYDLLEKSFRNKLYKSYGAQIYCQFTGDNNEENFNQTDFNYYVSLFKQIELAGGCVSITDYNGMDGDASQNSEWLKNMIEAGKITMTMVEEDKYGEIKFNATSPSSDSNVSYTTTTTLDKSELAKAEAKYEHDTKKIDAKDKKFDMDLSKLETERAALTKEYESVKKVINDNIERTFGIFS